MGKGDDFLTAQAVICREPATEDSRSTSEARPTGNRNLLAEPGTGDTSKKYHTLPLDGPRSLAQFEKGDFAVIGLIAKADRLKRADAISKFTIRCYPFRFL